MWELDYKESWVLKNWCFWTVVLEKTLESPLDCKEIQPVHPKGDQSWVFIGGTDVEAETKILWPADKKSWLIWKDPEAGKDWGQEDKGTTEDEMVGWHHWLDGHGFGWTLGAGDGQGGLVCCGSWGRKESVTTERLNWTKHLTNVMRTLQTTHQKTVLFIYLFSSIYIFIQFLKVILHLQLLQNNDYIPHVVHRELILHTVAVPPAPPPLYCSPLPPALCWA